MGKEGRGLRLQSMAESFPLGILNKGFNKSLFWDETTLTITNMLSGEVTLLIHNLKTKGSVPVNYHNPFGVSEGRQPRLYPISAMGLVTFRVRRRGWRSATPLFRELLCLQGQGGPRRRRPLAG